MQESSKGDQLLAEYVRLMGPDWGRLCHELRNESELLQWKWNQFHELFGKGPERIELLNSVASNFFSLVHMVLFESVMLQLCRLTDPTETLGHPNLTLRSLAPLIRDEAFGADVRSSAEQTEERCQFARDLRNKRLAHADLATYRNEGATPLPTVTAMKVEDALKSVGSLLNAVEAHYGVPPSLLAGDPWGAGSLVHYLEVATQAKQQERQRRRELAEGKSGAS